MIKAVFFDIDWTLFDHRSRTWDKESLEAIRKLKQNGVKIFLATARPFASTKSFGLFDLGIDWDGYVCCSGGVAVVDGQTVFKTVVKKEDVDTLRKACFYYHQTMEIVGEKERRLVAPPTSSAKRYYEVYRDRPQIVDSSCEFDAISLLLFIDRKYDRRFHRLVPHLDFYRFFDYAIDVVEIPHKKSDGIAGILRFLKVEKSEAIAFGDDYQDICMAEAVGTFVAMGNGVDKVKEAASFVTDPVWDAGVAKALKKLTLV